MCPINIMLEYAIRALSCPFFFFLHLLLNTPHFIAALGLMQRMKLQVVLSSVMLRSCMDARKALATVGFTRVCKV